MRGRLIVFEGPEGAGKTTQLQRVARALGGAGLPVTECREPGGTALGDEIRRLLLHRPADMAPRAEALLFMASRAELVAEAVRPALDAGHVVLLDRFFLSTYAYQSAGRAIPEEEIRAANAVAVAGLVPDLTLLLRLSAADGLKRASARGEPDRMEGAGSSFHETVAAAFELYASPAWQRAHPECGPIVTIDASRSEDAVFHAISRELKQLWPETFAGPLESHIRSPGFLQ